MADRPIKDLGMEWTQGNVKGHYYYIEPELPDGYTSRAPVGVFIPEGLYRPSVLKQYTREVDWVKDGVKGTSRMTCLRPLEFWPPVRQGQIVPEHFRSGAKLATRYPAKRIIYLAPADPSGNDFVITSKPTLPIEEPHNDRAFAPVLPARCEPRKKAPKGPKPIPHAAHPAHEFDKKAEHEGQVGHWYWVEFPSFKIKVSKGEADILRHKLPTYQRTVSVKQAWKYPAQTGIVQPDRMDVFVPFKTEYGPIEVRPKVLELRLHTELDRVIHIFYHESRTFRFWPPRVAGQTVATQFLKKADPSDNIPLVSRMEKIEDLPCDTDSVDEVVEDISDPTQDVFDGQVGHWYEIQSFPTYLRRIAAGTYNPGYIALEGRHTFHYPAQVCTVESFRMRRVFVPATDVYGPFKLRPETSKILVRTSKKEVKRKEGKSKVTWYVGTDDLDIKQVDLVDDVRTISMPVETREFLFWPPRKPGQTVPPNFLSRANPNVSMGARIELYQHDPNVDVDDESGPPEFPEWPEKAEVTKSLLDRHMYPFRTQQNDVDGHVHLIDWPVLSVPIEAGHANYINYLAQTVLMMLSPSERFVPFSTDYSPILDIRPPQFEVSCTAQIDPKVGRNNTETGPKQTQVKVKCEVPSNLRFNWYPEAFADQTGHSEYPRSRPGVWSRVEVLKEGQVMNPDVSDDAKKWPELAEGSKKRRWKQSREVTTLNDKQYVDYATRMAVELKLRQEEEKILGPYTVRGPDGFYQKPVPGFRVASSPLVRYPVPLDDNGEDQCCWAVANRLSQRLNTTCGGLPDDDYVDMSGLNRPPPTPGQILGQSISAATHRAGSAVARSTRNAVGHVRNCRCPGCTIL